MIDKIRSDEEIVSRITAGDIEAYRELMQRYEQKLLRYVLYLARDQISSSDVVQDTFIKAYKNLRSFNPKYKFSSWIFRIAHNETMNAIKKERHINRNIDVEEMDNFSKEPSTAEIIDRSIANKKLADCMVLLEEKYREVLLLQYFEKMKYSEIADILHIPLSTVGVRANRAKAKLKKICVDRGVKYE